MWNAGRKISRRGARQVAFLEDVVVFLAVMGLLAFLGFGFAWVSVTFGARGLALLALLILGLTGIDNMEEKERETKTQAVEFRLEVATKLSALEQPRADFSQEQWFRAANSLSSKLGIRQTPEQRTREEVLRDLRIGVNKVLNP
jgi:hypothetical protein